MSASYDIAILLPTRGRDGMLDRSLRSLIDCASRPDRIQIMLAFDRDDELGIQYFLTHIQPWLDQQNVDYEAMQFEPMGYIRLNEYVNALAKHSDANWLVFWNDDAVMETADWDATIMSYHGQFKLLAFHTHNDHPYSIFPIVPRAWFDLLGYLSPHQISDAWLSQQAYMLDIWQRIPVHVLHDRHDLTGNNNDETFRNRPMLEGNPMDSRDFHSAFQTNRRIGDCAKIAGYLKVQHNQDMSWFENVLAGAQDPWEKLKINDVNKQMVQFKLAVKNNALTIN